MSVGILQQIFQVIRDNAIAVNNVNQTLTTLLPQIAIAGPVLGGAETSVASAATTDLNTATTRVLVTGSTGPITSFGTTPNLFRIVRFSGTPTITYNATSLNLPNASDIVVTTNDTAIFVSDASGNWRLVNYQRWNATP
jgi:hypothetical protein